MRKAAIGYWLLAIGVSLGGCGKKAEPPASAPVQVDAPVKAPAPQPEIKRVWVEVDPVQCKGNPWDKFPGIGGLTGFFAEKGVKVYDTTTISYNLLYGQPTAVCRACSCPKGEVLYLWVAATDAAKLTPFGFKPATVDPQVADSYAGSRRPFQQAAPAPEAPKPALQQPAPAKKAVKKKPVKKKRRRS